MAYANGSDRTFQPTFGLKHQRGAAGEPPVDIPIDKMTGEVYELSDQVDHIIAAMVDGHPLLTTVDARREVSL